MIFKGKKKSNIYEFFFIKKFHYLLFFFFCLGLGTVWAAIGGTFALITLLNIFAYANCENCRQLADTFVWFLVSLYQIVFELLKALFICLFTPCEELYNRLNSPATFGQRPNLSRQAPRNGYYQASDEALRWERAQQQQRQQQLQRKLYRQQQQQQQQQQQYYQRQNDEWDDDFDFE